MSEESNEKLRLIAKLLSEIQDSQETDAEPSDVNQKLAQISLLLAELQQSREEEPPKGLLAKLSGFLHHTNRLEDLEWDRLLFRERELACELTSAMAYYTWEQANFLRVQRLELESCRKTRTQPYWR